MSAPVVVVGDSLLDIDVIGRSSRLCPDAPAPVVDVETELARPGGAALAAALAASDGHEVVLVTPLGDDAEAEQLAGLLEPRVRVVRLATDGTTAVKRRVRVQGQTLARLDTGRPGRLDAGLPTEVARLLGAGRSVLVSDYGRGTTGHERLRDLLQQAARKVPVVWDPHPRGAAPVPGCRAVTPNAVEAFAMAGSSAGQQGFSAGHAHNLRDAGAAAAVLVSGWSAAAVVVTIGADGALLSYGEGTPLLVPAEAVAHGDPCGAGDRFASRLTTLLAEGQVLADAVVGATAAATAFVAGGGAAGFVASLPSDTSAAPVPDVVARVRAAGGTVVATGGCFDLLHAGHVASLRAARGLGDCLVVCVNSDASVRRIKGPGRPVVRAEDRVRVLEALSCVDAVLVFDEDSPVALLDRLRPDLWAKGGDYAGTQLPEAALLQRWGGQAVVLPYLEGRSTTRLVEAMTPVTAPREEKT